MQFRDENVRYRKTWIYLLAMVLLFSTVLAACSPNQQGSESEEPRVLRIATLYNYGGGYDHIRTQYTDLFEFTNPNIEIEFVSAVQENYYGMYPTPDGEETNPIDELKKLMEGPNPPDLVMIDYEYLSTLIEDNLLMPLDSLMAENNFDTSDFAPAVIDGIRALGNNQLYALAPMFSSSAIVYNRGLFDRMNVEYPHDDMTWDELFELARRVTGSEGENKVYGFSFQPYFYSDPYYDMQLYTAPLELKMTDDAMETMTVDTPAWASAWNTIVQLKKDGIFPEEPPWNEMGGVDMPYNPFQHDAFMSGKLAMTIMHYGRLDELINANQNADRIEGYEPIDWEVAAIPFHPQYPDVGGQVYLEALMGINAKAENVEDAWALFEFIHGERWAQLKSRSSYNFVSRTSYIEPKQGLDYNIEAFFKRIPAPNPYSNMYRLHPEYYQIEHIGRMKFQQVIEDQLTVEQALAEWQNEGNQVLQQIKENRENPDSIDGSSEAILREQLRRAAGL